MAAAFARALATLSAPTVGEADNHGRPHRHQGHHAQERPGERTQAGMGMTEVPCSVIHGAPFLPPEKRRGNHSLLWCAHAGVDCAARVESAEARRGRKTRKVVDQPGVSTMSTKPSWASATDLAMASPRPVPGTPISMAAARR